MHTHGLADEALRCGYIALGREQEVDAFALLVDGAIQIFSDAFDLDVGLIHTPAAAAWALVFPTIFSTKGRK